MPPSAKTKQPITIALDYTTGVYPGAGVARYTRSLMEALAQIDRTNSYRLFYGARNLPRDTPEYARMRQLLGQYANVELREIPLSPRQLNALWHRAKIPAPVETFIGQADVVHSPDFLTPPVARGRAIITVQDLSFMVVPEYSDPGNREYLMKALPRSIERADRIVAVSEAARQDVIKLFNVRPEKVVAVSNGVEPQFKPMSFLEKAQAQQDPQLLGKLRLPEKYILFLGTLEPRKNLARLIEAYAHLRQRSADQGAHLVLAGRRGWMYDDIFRKVEQFGLQPYVHFMNYVPEETLPLLFNMATMFVYPSLYEGFGLPVVEAMACGVPVITSNSGALAEVAGKAALLIDPESSEAITAAIETVLQSVETRAFLAEAGPARAAHFPWTATARQMLGVYSGAV